MSKTPPQEVGPATAAVVIVVALIAVILTYAILLKPRAATGDQSATTAALVQAEPIR